MCCTPLVEHTGGVFDIASTESTATLLSVPTPETLILGEQPGFTEGAPLAKNNSTALFFVRTRQ